MTQHNKLLASVLTGTLILGMSAAHATICNGFYIGGQLGRTLSNYNVGTAGINSATSINRSGTGWRADLGYQFDQNWGMELGYTRPHSVVFNGMNATAVRGKVSSSAWDLVGVGRLPFDNGFGLFAKAGLQRYTAKPDIGLQNAQVVSNRFGATRHASGLIWGVGASYDFNPNVSGDVSWTRFSKRNNVQNTDFLGVGLAYYFG